MGASVFSRISIRWQRLLNVLLSRLIQAFDHALDLTEELITHHFFRDLRKMDWSDYQLGPLVVCSLLINLLELVSPLYINIVYSSVLPTGSMESLLVLTFGAVVLMLLGGWLKAVRLGLTGDDGARLEHRNRLAALDHFCRIPLGNYLRLTPAAHGERLNSINLLRDEASVQSLTTAIDLLFSLLFVLVLFLIGGSIGVIAVLAIIVYLLRALQYARDYEGIARHRDALELARSSYQSQLLGAIDLIKANGLGRQYLVGHERRHEELAHQRVRNTRFSGQYQAFGALTSQIALAAMVTWGAYLVISDRLLVGALAACLLLAGKVLGPWQQAMGLWNNYRRLGHARDQYDALMAEPVEADGGDEQLQLTAVADAVLTIRIGDYSLPALPIGDAAVIRDDHYGAAGRRLFLALLQLQLMPGLHLNGQPIERYQRAQLRRAIAYADPSADFFDGNLMQNLTGFQPRRHQRLALFWSYLSGLDQKVRQLPQGYGTSLGQAPSSGLSRDALMLAQLVRALATDPQVLLIDLNRCAYGKEFIDGLERILQRTRGRLTVLISGGGRVLDGLSQQKVHLPALVADGTLGS
jgi:ABC-type bacteriocin/lantibiotic exporter with double-glycine peptidase domain